jgi:tetratricopeptide (TPR) repeat protein
MGLRIEESDLDIARQFIKKTFELDNESPDGQFVSALIEMTGGDARLSISKLRKVLQHEPNHANALFWLAQILAILGLRKPAFEMYERLILVDPFSPLVAAWPTVMNIFCGEFEWARKSSEKLGTDDISLIATGAAFTYNLKASEAEAVFGKISDGFKNTNVFKGDILVLNAFIGKFDEVQNQLNDRKFILWAKNDLMYSFQVAEALAMRSDREEALDWLEIAINRGNFNYPFINEYDPFLQNLRGEKRFRDLMNRIKEEWENFV